MTIAKGYRPFLILAPLHLAAWGVLEVLNAAYGQEVVPWDAQLWLLLTGFVGFYILGFLLHLAPTLLRRALPSRLPPLLLFGMAESGVLLGTVGQIGYPVGFVLGTVLWAVSIAVLAFALFLSLRGPPRSGPAVRKVAETVVVPLVLASVLFNLAASLEWCVAALWPSTYDAPGFGLWVGGVHLFVLGQVLLLIIGVSYYLIPRALGSDVPSWLARVLPALSISGAALIGGGMVLLPTSNPVWLALAALPEAAAGLLYFAGVFLLVLRATTWKPTAVLFLASPAFLLVGGAMGLAMAGSGHFRYLEAHALTNLFGFAGTMIMAMAFSMLAPFQYLSHTWTIRVLRVELGLLTLAVILAFLRDAEASPFVPGTTALLGATMMVAGALVVAGVIPVLYYEPKGALTTGMAKLKVSPPMGKH